MRNLDHLVDADAAIQNGAGEHCAVTLYGKTVVHGEVKRAVGVAHGQAYGSLDQLHEPIHSVRLHLLGRDTAAGVISITYCPGIVIKIRTVSAQA